MKATKKENMARLLEQKRQMVDSIRERIMDNNGRPEYESPPRDQEYQNPAEQETEDEIRPSFEEKAAGEPEIVPEEKPEPMPEVKLEEPQETGRVKILKRDIPGKWELKEHTVKGEDYLALFIRNRFKGIETSGMVYSCFYEFKGRICLKTLIIKGNIMTKGKAEPYHYMVRLTISYRIAENGNLRVILESGYLHYQTGEGFPVLKDFEPDDNAHEMEISLHKNELTIIDKSEDSRMLLKRMV
jgi:hypothetical protein